MANLVNYVKKLWKDAPSTDSPINAENLNHIEGGIFNNAEAINALGERADDLEADVTQINADLTDIREEIQNMRGARVVKRVNVSAGGTFDISEFGFTSDSEYSINICGFSNISGFYGLGVTATSATSFTVTKAGSSNANPNGILAEVIDLR